MENSHLYTLKDEELEGWLEVIDGQFDKRKLPKAFLEVSLKVMEALGVRLPGRPTTS